MGNKSLPLVEAAFAWAREAGAEQPLTVAVWGGIKELSDKQLELSDIVSFHFYGDHAGMQARIADCKRQGRPVICTEWMARTLGASKSVMRRFHRWPLPLFRRQFQHAGGPVWQPLPGDSARRPQHVLRGCQSPVVEYLFRQRRRCAVQGTTRHPADRIRCRRRTQTATKRCHPALIPSARLIFQGGLGNPSVPCSHWTPRLSQEKHSVPPIPLLIPHYTHCHKL